MDLRARSSPRRARTHKCSTNGFYAFAGENKQHENTNNARNNAEHLRACRTPSPWDSTKSQTFVSFCRYARRGSKPRVRLFRPIYPCKTTKLKTTYMLYNMEPRNCTTPYMYAPLQLQCDKFTFTKKTPVARRQTNSLLDHQHTRNHSSMRRRKNASAATPQNQNNPKY